MENNANAEGINMIRKRQIQEIESKDGCQQMEFAKVSIATNPYRDQVIEEVAQHVEKLVGFGQDTVSSLSIYIRDMKK